MTEKTVRHYLFDCPGLYKIRVAGKLDECWLAHLEGLEISTDSWGKYQYVTQINGWLDDQTALSGLLDLLNNLGSVILTVERLGDDEQND